MQAIQSTDSDALLSKISSIQKGYLNDKYSTKFARKREKKSPLINRGTFLRVASIDGKVDEFLGKFKDLGNIISLGAGSDARYFLLKAVKKNPKYVMPVIPRYARNHVILRLYVEIDYGEVTTKKAMTIYKDKEMKGLLESIHIGTPSP